MQTKPKRELLTASYDWYRQMRETQPVFFDQKMQTWHLFRYDDVARVLSDHATFSSNESSFLPPEYRNATPISSSLLR
ncbi:MAG: cytochrome P450, partial [Chloroflexi bacterium]|nr:cytochrome P450 [Chloroflexota bacterium]